MKKILGVSLIATTAVVTGIALLAFSPITCACLSPVDHLLLLARLDYTNPEAGRIYSTQQITDGLKRYMTGQQITPEQPHKYFNNCVVLSENMFRCTVEAEKSPLLTRNYAVTVTTDSEHRLVDIGVERSWAWL